MFTFVVRRFVFGLSSRIANPTLAPLTRTLVPVIRPLSLSPVHRSFPNMQQMMDEISKNPKAMQLLEAIKKDPKILRAVQDLMMTMNKKGYIDLNNPAKQPS